MTAQTNIEQRLTRLGEHLRASRSQVDAAMNRIDWTVDVVRPSKRYAKGVRWTAIGSIAACVLVGICLWLAGASRDGPAKLQPSGAAQRPADRGRPTPGNVDLKGTQMKVSFSLVDVVLAGGKWGFIDTQGNVVIEPRFGRVRKFSCGMAGVRMKQRWGFIDAKGQWAIEPQFQNVGDFSEGLAPVRVDGKWGYVDQAGNMRIPPRFDWSGRFVEGVALAKLDGLYGYVDHTGALRIPARYGSATEVSGGYAGVLTEKGWGYIRHDGTFAIAPKFEKVSWGFREGLAAATKDGKWGFINTKGRFVIEPKFEELVWCFSDGLARVKLAGKYGYVDKTGRVLVEPKYEYASEYYEGGLAHVRDGDGDKIINTAGRAVPLRGGIGWASGKFSNGLMRARADGNVKTKQGFVDAAGAWVIPPKFEWAEDFSEGYAAIAEGLNWALLDDAGENMRRKPVPGF